MHRALIVRVENAGSLVSFYSSKLRFDVHLKTRESWHSCIKFIPVLDGKSVPPLYGCCQFLGIRDQLDRKRVIFLNEATKFKTDETKPNLAAVVEAALNRGMHDLAALRLPDLNYGKRSWVTAAGLPIYIAFFGRDTVTVGWQACVLSTAMAAGALLELPKWQGKVENNWRDEQPRPPWHFGNRWHLRSDFGQM